MWEYAATIVTFATDLRTKTENLSDPYFLLISEALYKLDEYAYFLYTKDTTLLRIFENLCEVSKIEGPHFISNVINLNIWKDINHFVSEVGHLTKILYGIYFRIFSKIKDFIILFCENAPHIYISGEQT